MSNIFDQTRQAVQEAKDTLRAADGVATDMAILLQGRLRHVDLDTWRGTEILCALKRELRDFDMTTGKWKELGNG